MAHLVEEFDIHAREIQTFPESKTTADSNTCVMGSQRNESGTETPHLTELLDNDFSWWTKFYPPSDVLHPKEWKQRINQKCYNMLR